jgi:hypothetical protein
MVYPRARRSAVDTLNPSRGAQAVAHHTPERDVWQMAVLMEERYGADAPLESAVLAEHLLADGDWRGAERWHRIRDAIEWLRAKAPGRGEAVH